jgi:hypothetical protein
MQIAKPSSIESKIFTIRGVQVMLDHDLAEIYQIETKLLNKAVKRNIERFPSEFMFQLTSEELDSLRFQFGTLKNKRGKHRKYLPYAFTEQGVAMLSAILRSDVAVKVSIEIMNAFVQMRRLMLNNAQLYQRLDHIELKQITTDKKLDKFEQIFTALEKDIKPKQGIFFEGQLFDAYAFAADLVKNAKKSLVLIDNYVDETTLLLLSKRKKAAKAIIYTKKINKQLMLDLEKHNSQYPEIEVLIQSQSHDRFLIIDNVQVYHFGASLKDLGHKCFAFSRMDFVLNELQDKILKQNMYFILLKGA